MIWVHPRVVQVVQLSLLPLCPLVGIRQLQLILLKVALLLGVEVHTKVQFKGLHPPTGKAAGQGKAWP